MTNSLLERDARALGAIGKLRCFPLTIKHAHGNCLIEEDGREVLDLSASAGAALLGYGHPAVAAAAQRGFSECAGASDMFGASEAAVSLAEALLERVPGQGERRVWLGHSGSDANDTAMRAIAAATGRRRFLSFYGAYHGGVSGSMSVSSHPSQQHSLPRAGLVQIPYPNPYRPLSGGDAAQPVLDYLDFLFDSGVPPDDIGACFIEPLQSDGGMIVPPPGFLAALQARCRRHGILLVSDEVKVGLGRSGRLNCFEWEGIAPDIVTLGKGLGSGLPLSALVGPAAVLDVQPAFALITTTGNAVCASVGSAVLRAIEAEDLIAKAAARGARIMAGLKALQAKHPLLGEVRGRGLAIGLELVRDRASKEPATSEAAKLVYRAYQLGVVCTYVGLHSNIPELTPPLTLSEAEADRAVEVLGQALDDVEEGRVSDEEVAAYAGW
ncbi:MAG: aspartate aminotransferase family protein [Rhodospirillales bacterium]